MKKTKKVIASLAISAMVATMMPFNAFAATGVTTDRLFGADRFQTAINVSDKFVSASTAILAPAANANLVDALAAAPLAGKDAPILLTDNNTLTAATKAQLIKLGVTKVYVVGAISDAVLAEVNALPGVTATALKGASRIETAAKINAELTAPSGTFVVGYYALADALSVASFAAANNYSIVVANPDGSLPASANLATSNVYVIGGPTLVKDVAGAERLYGADRFATNKQVLDNLTFSYDKVFVANGTQGHLVDSLVASSLAAKAAAPIVLTNTTTGGDAAAVSVAAKLADNAVVTALGGATVVTNNTLGKVAGTVQVGDVELAIASVSALTDDGRVLSVAFNKAYSGAIDKSMVQIYNTKNLARVGVESVQLSSDGKSLEVSVYDTENKDEIVRLTEYTIVVGSLKANFTRPAYLDKDTNSARVTAVDAAEREITLTFNAYVGSTWTTGLTKVLEVPESIKINFQEALGQDFQVWYNGDDEILNFAYQSNKVLLDAIEVTEDYDASAKEGELELIGLEDEYDIASGVVLYVDGTQVTSGSAIEAALEDGDTFEYAKITLNDSGDVQYINAFNWDSHVIVEEVEDDVLYGYNEDLDTEDFIIVKDGKQISVDDIKAGDIVYYNETAYDDGIAEVFNGIVTGKITNFFSDGFELDGELYDYDSAQTLDSDGDVITFGEDEAEEMEAAGGTVSVYLDRSGDVVFVTGDSVAVEGDEQAAYLTENILGYQTATRDYIELEYVDAAGDAQVDVVRLQDLESISVDGTEYEIDNTSTPADEYFVELNSGDTPGNTHIMLNLAGATANAQTGDTPDVAISLAATDNTVIELTKDDDGNITDINFITTSSIIWNDPSASYQFESDDSYVKISSTVSKKLADDVIVFNTEDGTDAEDITVKTYGELAQFDINTATVFYDGDKVTSLVIGSTDSADTTDYDAVITDVRSNTDGIVRISAFVKGVEKTYVVDEVSATVAEGDVVTLTVDDETGIVESIATSISRQTGRYDVVDVRLSDREVDVNTTTTPTAITFELVSGAVVYDVTDPSDITVENIRDLDDLTTGQQVIFIRDGIGTKYVRAVIIVD